MNFSFRVLLVAALFSSSLSAAPADRKIPFSGVIEHNDNRLEGDVSFQFSLFAAETGGNALWTSTEVLQANQGRFSVVFGASAPLPDVVFTQEKLFLEIEVEGTLLRGRQQIFASHQLVDPPNEFRAGSVSTDEVGAGSITATDIDAASVTTGTLNSGPANTGTLNVQTPETVGQRNWRVGLKIVGEHGAIYLPSSQLLFGLHSNGNFYWRDDAADTYPAILNRNGNFTALGQVAGSSLKANNTPAILGIQSGVIGNCSIHQNAGSGGTLVFPVAFSTPPVVILTANEPDYAGCVAVRAQGISNTGFSWKSYVGSSSVACNCVQWMAIAQ